VNSGQRYRATVVEQCHVEQTHGRIQINWHDNKDKFISASIQLFDCGESWQEHTADFIAPNNAAKAEVYATSHTAVPIEVKYVSFKQ